MIAWATAPAGFSRLKMYSAAFTMSFSTMKSMAASTIIPTMFSGLSMSLIMLTKPLGALRDEHREDLPRDLEQLHGFGP